MTDVVHKLALPLTGTRHNVVLPATARVVAVRRQGVGVDLRLCVWFIRDTEDASTVPWRVEVRGTGDPLPPKTGDTGGWAHWGTVFTDDAATYVFHLFARHGHA